MKSENIIAFGKLTSRDKHALWANGQPLGDYREILIEIVVDKSVPLPRPFGKITKMSQTKPINIS
jgi:hypothetical protein